MTYDYDDKNEIEHNNYVKHLILKCRNGVP